MVTKSVTPSSTVEAGTAVTITGNDFNRQDSLSFFVQRVRSHPTDVAARLDLAARYEQRGAPQDATAQYLAALRLNPRNAEANASVGELLYLSGDARSGLRYARRSLSADRTYPEGLYVEGVMTLIPLDRLESRRLDERGVRAVGPVVLRDAAVNEPAAVGAGALAVLGFE